MRVNRGKAIRKYLRFYRIVYGMEAPYHVILDGNFIYHAVKYKIDVMARLEQQLQTKVAADEVRIYITASALEELKSVTAEHASKAVEFATRMCAVLDDSAAAAGAGSGASKNTTTTTTTTTAGEQLASFLQSTHHRWVRSPTSAKASGDAGDSSTSTGGSTGAAVQRYIVATQDKDLRHTLAHIPGVPLFYFNAVVLVMEPPSDAAKSFNTEMESIKTAATTHSELAMVQSVNRKRVRDGEDVGSNVVGPLLVPAPASGKARSDGSGGGPEQKKQRVKHKAKSANPMAIKAPSKGSGKQKKVMKNKYK